MAIQRKKVAFEDHFPHSWWAIWWEKARYLPNKDQSYNSTILTQPYNKVTELARDPRPVSAFSDTFFILANQSSDPAIQQLSASWIVHYEFEEAIKNSSESKVVMCESSSSLQYILRSIQRLLSNLNNIWVNQGQDLQMMGNQLCTSWKKVYSTLEYPLHFRRTHPILRSNKNELFKLQ